MESQLSLFPAILRYQARDYGEAQEEKLKTFLTKLHDIFRKVAKLKKPRAFPFNLNGVKYSFICKGLETAVQDLEHWQHTLDLSFHFKHMTREQEDDVRREAALIRKKATWSLTNLRVVDQQIHAGYLPGVQPVPRIEVPSQSECHVSAAHGVSAIPRRIIHISGSSRRISMKTSLLTNKRQLHLHYLHSSKNQPPERPLKAL